MKEQRSVITRGYSKLVDATIEEANYLLNRFAEVKQHMWWNGDQPSQVGIYTKPGVCTYYPVDWDRLIDNSYKACKQVDEVNVSPYMKNALIRFGDIKEDERLRTNAPLTKAEAYIQDKVEKALSRMYGKEVLEYDRTLGPCDMKHYVVDNFRNFKKGVAWRDIQPGQAEQREEGFETFRKPSPQTPSLFTDSFIRAALSTVLEELPHNVHASTDYRDWSGPFENKHTQVSFPFGYQDDVIVSEDNDPSGKLRNYYGMTYGQLCVELARNTPIAAMLYYKWYMGYGRNQRGKGRPLIAEARIPAIMGNRMTSVESELAKVRSPMFIGYNDRDTLKRAMQRQATFVMDNKLAMENFDYHAFDQSISKQWLALAGAIWSVLAADKTARDIVRYRTWLGFEGLLIDGIAPTPGEKVAQINGRQFSGELETNKSENVINGTASTASMIRQDGQWVNKILRRSPYPRMYMGDDCLITYDPSCFDHDVYVKDISDYGFEVHPDKGEFGCFFLQNRLVLDENGWFMAYPWTRVVKSCFMQEKSKGLGPTGWTLATWMKLANIMEYEPGLAFVRDLVMEFDDEKLMLDVPISEIISKIQQEDVEAKKQNKRARSTLDIINDGDPGKHQLTRTDSRYLTKLQRTIREA